MKSRKPFFLQRLLARFSPKLRNKVFCSTEGLWDEYFAVAEGCMDASWEELIWPVIKDLDFENVLELAPGAGRNTEKLAAVSRSIHAVDLNEYALKKLRDRFRDYTGGCSLHVHKNDGSDLGMIESGSISLIYCWDAAVHFEKSVLRAYMREFARVLTPNGSGFVHHANLGKAGKPDINLNPGWRSNMSKDLFAKYCAENDLDVIRQIDVPWGAITDCISVFRKKASGRA